MKPWTFKSLLVKELKLKCRVEQKIVLIFMLFFVTVMFNKISET